MAGIFKQATLPPATPRDKTEEEHQLENYWLRTRKEFAPMAGIPNPEEEEAK